LWAPASDPYYWSALVVAFTASLGSSLHCVGMCGPIRLLCAQGTKARVHYQAGRATGYAVLGCGVGAIGSAVPPWVLIPLVLFALTLKFVTVPGLRLWTPIRKAALRAASGNPALLGLASALLPCGLLHGWLVAAAATSSALAGGTLMLALWLGTLPALELSSTLLRRPFQSLRSRFPRALPAALLLTAIIPMGYRYSASFQNSKDGGPACHHGSPVPTFR
jgi:sulfite exporter TauE/SafE